MCFVSPPGHQTVHDPKIPYVGPIHGGLKIGMSIFIRGKVLPDCNNFNVNLQCAEEACSGIPLHINPRFVSEVAVVLNNFKHGHWKEEVRPAGMPFCCNRNFELLIEVTPEGYQVNVDGNPFHLFKHRMRVQRVKFLAIGGGVSIQVINIIGGGQGGICRKPREGQLVKIPHMEPIHGGLKVGMSLHVQGTVPQRLKRFHIDFRCGSMRCADIALHFKPVFKHCEVVVFNSCHQGHWKKEEIPSWMPFCKGKSFDLVITVTSEGFQVTVDDKHLHLFRHRMPLNRVTFVEIDGHISVQTFNMMGGGQEVDSGHPGRRQLVIHRIPYAGPISGGLRPGMTIFFHGTVHQRIRGFNINLQSGKACGSDIALHFNPRFCPCEIVVFNDFCKNWHEEERRPMQFRRGESFNLVIAVTTEGYQVNVDGNDYHLFRHRMPVECVRFLTIGGDVTMHTVYITDVEERPAQEPEFPILSGPHVTPIVGGFRPRMSVYIQGWIPRNCKSFMINFNCGDMNCCDKAFHFRPYFVPMAAFVCNSFQCGRWKKEEWVQEMPFTKGESFELVILITSHGYQVKVNDVLVHTFKHRIIVRRVTKVEILGDVSVQTVNVLEADQGDMQGQPDVRALVIDRIPYLGPIHGLRPGMSILFQGTVNQQYKWFCINLKCGMMRCADIALHFNPRCSTVVHNTFCHGWQTEEVVSQMPFTPGADFELVIAITQDGYQLNVNDQSFYFYKHRIALERVKALEISGDISIHNVNVINDEDGGVPKSSVGPQLPNTPYNHPLHVGLRAGMSVYIQGMVPQKCSRFGVHFRCGSTRHSDVALLFNPRFCPRGVVLFKTFQRGRWRKADRVCAVPFIKGEEFELLFNITSKGYEVNVGGHVFHTFPHCIPVGRVNSIVIGGQVFVQTVETIEAAQDDALARVGGGEILIPSVPYVGPVSGGLTLGKRLVFRGTVLNRTNRFNIDLQCGQMACSDKALHIQFRFGRCSVVVFNSFQCRWGRAERVHKMPFRKGENFELVIMVTAKGYQVYINGRKYYFFNHRISLDRVQAFAVGGGVTIQSLNISEEEPEDLPTPKVEKTVMTVPHRSPIPGHLRLGMTVVVTGTLPANCIRFSVNLQCGQKDEADIAYHFNPRFDSSTVVLNTCVKGGWQEEVVLNEMPFAKEQSFELIIHVTAAGYQTKVNGKYYCTFQHRMPLRRVQAVFVQGDITLHSVDIFEGKQGAIQICPGIKELAINTPYLRPVIGGLRTGMSVYIQGTLPRKLKWFNVNFTCGESKCADIALHLNPRFCPCEVFVLNSFCQGWQEEMRVQKMPFTKGADFEMVIAVTSAGYQVHVNSHLFYTFRHRMQVERVTNIQIGGAIFVRNVEIIGGVQRGVARLGHEELVVNSIPYVGSISGRLIAGTSLVFQGTVHNQIDSFHINLRCGQMKCSAIAFHFNPRFKGHEVLVMNSYHCGWAAEERVQKMPFTRNGSFELVFVITSDGYQVLVDGCFLYFFKHRIPVQRVRALEIGGNVSIQSVNIIRMSTPYVHCISRTLKPGMLLSIQGMVPHNAKGFSINLLCGEKDGSDNAFHCNPRLASNCLVLNTLVNGGWGNEERPSGEMPFSRGENFELLIAVLPQGYQLIVNGRTIYLYAHRIPMERVTCLSIIQDVSVWDIDITEGEPEAIPTFPGGRDRLVIPYVQNFSRGLRPGMCLYFKGIAPDTQFAINLKTGENNIALHVNPRLRTETVVVFNTCVNGGWQNEERPSKMPFCKGESFELFILVKSQGYQTIANGCKFYFYKHRIPLNQVTSLEITADAVVQTVEIEGDIQICPGVPEPLPLPKLVVVGDIPYVRPLTGPLTPGMSVYFQGITPRKPRGFSLNFKCGEGKDSDIAMHYNPRFCPCLVTVFNSFQGGWQTEERVNDLLFNKGESFEVVVFITTEGYKVTVNGCVLYTFKHRIDLGRVTALTVVGDVSVEALEVIQGLTGEIAICPGIEFPDEDKIPEEPKEPEITICEIPQLRPVYDGLSPGMNLNIQGIVIRDINGFAINLRCGEKPDSDIALHFNVRFTESVVVLNTCQGGGWGKEERPEVFPFCKGREFNLVIMITQAGYQLIVDGCQFYSYNHRIPVKDIRALEMDGNFTSNITKAEEEPEKEEEKVVAPYTQALGRTLKPGMALYFDGSAPRNLKGFSINLLCGEQDIAIHFNPRFDGGVVVLNSFENGIWKNEERPSEMPFAWEEDFVVIFAITSQGYQVFVNDHPFYLFNHRIPFEQVTSLRINENVSIKAFNIIEEYIQESPEEEKEEEVVIDKSTLVSQYEQPFKTAIKVGTSLYFAGTVPDGLDRFVINLPCGETKDSDIAFSFTARLDTSVLELNSYQNGAWQKAEIVEVMPFCEGESFELAFVIVNEGYKVVINGVEVYMFVHRIKLELVYSMRIDGDVFIQSFEPLEITEEDQPEETETEDFLTIAPYVESIPGVIGLGKSLYFQGSFPEDISSFSISLQCGQTDGCDVAFYFKPEFEPSPATIFNHLKDGNWGQEERIAVMPFNKGEVFEIVITITQENFEVIGNGTKIHAFAHRIAFERITDFQIDGSVNMENITLIEKQIVQGGGESQIAICQGPDVAVIEECFQVSSYCQPIPRLKAGTSMYFQGSLPDEIDGFSIDLMCGESADSDIAFHFNPLFETSEVVFNYRENNTWGPEERIAMKHLTKGKDFELIFIINSDDFQVKLGGEEFKRFASHLDFSRVTAVQITGNVAMQTLNIIEKTEEVVIEGVLQVQGEEEMVTGDPIFSPGVPFSSKLTSEMNVKKTIIISGSVTAEASSFECNLVSSSGDIAFHLGPQIAEGVVKRNSCLGGNWGAEETEASFTPFQRDTQFEMAMCCLENKFAVFVNGQHFCDFAHRLKSFTEIDKLEIAGEVQLSYVVL